MGELMRSELVDVIQIANREFQDFIDQVSESGAKVVEDRGAMRSLAKVNLRLQSVAKCLAASSKSSVKAPDAAHEILKYRENLKTLRNVIEKLQLSLLAEKGKIENLRANMRAARAWAAAVREIS